MITRPDSRPDVQEGGFTLLEVMIAAMVLVGGMMAIMGLFGMALATHRANIDTARVAMIRAELLPEAQRLALVVDPDTGEVSYQGLKKTAVPGHPGFSYTLEIGTSQEESRTEVAVLRLTWWGGGREREAESRHVFRAEKPFSELIQTRFKEELKP